VKTGAKIAIGCVVVVVVLGVAGVVGMVGLGYWAKQKVTSSLEKIQGDQSQINSLLDKARTNPFTPPSDGVITEDQLVRFLEIRKRVFAVYRKYGQQLQALDKSKGDGVAALQRLSGMAGAFGEVRLAQAQALADVGMSPKEYTYLVGAVYKTYTASEIARQNGGRQMSQVMSEASKSMASAVPSAAPNEDDAARARREALDQANRQVQGLAEQSKAMDVPQANLDLFKKHEAEIKQYLMPGLEAFELALNQ
jgi:hypothetical protein